MTTSSVWPYVIGFGNPASAILVGAGMTYGWLLLAATQLVFVAYGLATDQKGFALQLAMVVIAVNNLIMWMQREQRPLLTGVLAPRLAVSRG